MERGPICTNMPALEWYHFYMSGPRTIFMGTPAYVAPILKALRALEKEGCLETVAIYTGQPRQSGRGLSTKSSAIEGEAREYGIPVMTPRRLNERDALEEFRALEAELIVLAAYGLLLPKPFLFEPKHGAVNVHPSLLPRHRGSAPVVGAILEGDGETGTTLIRMDEGLDTGPILNQRRVAMSGEEYAGPLTADLFKLGAEMLTVILPPYIRGEVPGIPQSNGGATFTTRLSKRDGNINWTEGAVSIERAIRAYDPWPGTVSRWGNSRIQILNARVLLQDHDQPPGTVLEQEGYPTVVTGAGSVLLKTVKLEGRRATDGREFLRGQPSFIGSRLTPIE